MKKIMLVCSSGMSTSLLVQKMQKVAKKRKLDVDIEAVAEAELKNRVSEINVILLGPQVKYLLDDMKKRMKKHDIAVEVIDSINYGTMNGKAVLEQALDMMED